MAEAGGAGADRHRFAGPLHHHAALAQIEAVELFRRGAQHIEARRGIVGDRVEEADFPVGDARIDDLDRRQREIDGAQHVGDGQSLIGEIAATAALVGEHRWAGLVFAVGIGRWGIPLCCRRGVPAARADGLGSLVAGTVSTAALLCYAPVLIGGSAGIAALSGTHIARTTILTGVALALVGLVATILLRHVVRRLRGITGDVIGAVCELSTAISLIVLSARP